MKIAVFDSWNQKFSKPVIEHWRDLGHEVKAGLYWGPELTEWCDVGYFAQCDNNAIQASRKQPKPPNTRIVIEAVDIDIYAGHPGAVNWDYASALIVMASHTEALVRKKSALRPGLPVHIVPGGIDLDKFTLRQQPRGFNVAWIGRFWIAKNVFGALQIFNQLIQTDPGNPWRLFLRGQKLDDPAWWGNHIRAYLKANPELEARTEFVPYVEDMNIWLEGMDYYLMTSLKEAFSYSTGECAAKGIKIIMGMTNGMPGIWPKDWIFQTHQEAVEMFSGLYEPLGYRHYVATHYSLEKRLELLDSICFGGG